MSRPKSLTINAFSSSLPASVEPGSAGLVSDGESLLLSLSKGFGGESICQFADRHSKAARCSSRTSLPGNRGGSKPVISELLSLFPGPMLRGQHRSVGRSI